MGRTCVNVVGNCLATCVIARWEGDRFAVRPEVGGPGAARTYRRETLADDAARCVARGRIRRSSTTCCRRWWSCCASRSTAGRRSASCRRCHADECAALLAVAQARSCAAGPGLLFGRVRGGPPGRYRPARAAVAGPPRRHRAEVNKLMVATALQWAGHRPEPPRRPSTTAACQRGRSLLLLNARRGDPAEAFDPAGSAIERPVAIPGYMVGASGEACDNVAMYRTLRAEADAGAGSRDFQS